MDTKERSRALHNAMDRGTPLDASKAHVNVTKMPLMQKLQLWTKEVLAVHAVDNTWEMVDGIPFWAMLFYLIRSGSPNDAMDYALRYEKYLAKTERRFLDYLSAWMTAPQHQLPKKLRQELLNDFNVRIRDGVLRSASSARALPHLTGLSSTMSPSSVDPYKYLVYRIIGRIGLDDTAIPNAVVKCLAGGILGWEDDLWFQLMLVREVDSLEASAASTGVFGEPAMTQQEHFSLKDLYDRYVTSFSVDTWTGNGAFPLRYFQILLLCGEFERAIQYLWNCGKTEFNESVGSRPLQGARWYSEIDAVHFAIALVYYGALHVPKEVYSMEMDIGSITEDGGRPMVQIHFARMLQIYTKSLFVRIAHPKEAAHYYFLLCLLDDDQEVSQSQSLSEEMKRLCYEWLIDLILETGLIDEFLGCIGFGENAPMRTEMRTPGFLDTFLPLIKLYSWDDFKRKIIRPAAERAERRAVAASQRAELGPSTVESSGLGKRELASISSVGEVELQQNNAILLYNLAEEYDVVLDILSKRVSASLSQRSLEAVVDPVLELIQQGHLQSSPSVLYSYDMEQLVRIEKTAVSVLDYYVSRTHILSKMAGDRRKTLSALIHLIEFYKSCIQVAKEFVSFKVEPAQMHVQQQEAGVSMRLGSQRGSLDWSAGLMLIEDIGLIPLGFTRQSQQKEFDSPRSVMGSRSATPSALFTPRASIGGGTPMRAPSSIGRESLLSSDVDYSRIMTKAEQLRREFSDLVLNHLPDIFLGTEMLILIAWHATRAKPTMADGSQMLSMEEQMGVRSWSRKSRQLQSFVSAVSRWYKIPSEIRRRLVMMDEVMMIQ